MRKDSDSVADAAERISAFLGDKNWNRRKVSDLINLKANFHPSVLKAFRTDQRSDHKTSLGQQDGVELAKRCPTDCEGRSPRVVGGKRRGQVHADGYPERRLSERRELDSARRQHHRTHPISEVVRGALAGREPCEPGIDPADLPPCISANWAGRKKRSRGCETPGAPL